MSNLQFLFTLFCTVFFCLGIRTVSDTGQLLYFLRKPFENLIDEIEYKKELLKSLPALNVNGNLSKQINILSIKYYLTKPTIICITCMASFWGVIWFVTLNSFSFNTLHYLILNSFCASFIQSFIWSIYEKYL